MLFPPEIFVSGGVTDDFKTPGTVNVSDSDVFKEQLYGIILSKTKSRVDGVAASRRRRRIFRAYASDQSWRTCFRKNTDASFAGCSSKKLCARFKE